MYFNDNATKRHPRVAMLLAIISRTQVKIGSNQRIDPTNQNVPILIRASIKP